MTDCSRNCQYHCATITRTQLDCLHIIAFTSLPLHDPHFSLLIALSTGCLTVLERPLSHCLCASPSLIRLTHLGPRANVDPLVSAQLGHFAILSCSSIWQAFHCTAARSPSALPSPQDTRQLRKLCRFFFALSSVLVVRRSSSGQWSSQFVLSALGLGYCKTLSPVASGQCWSFQLSLIALTIVKDSLSCYPCPLEHSYVIIAVCVLHVCHLAMSVLPPLSLALVTGTPSGLKEAPLRARPATSSDLFLFIIAAMCASQQITDALILSTSTLHWWTSIFPTSPPLSLSQ